MSTDEIIADWIAVSNAHNTAGYLSFFTDDVVLDDTSVGDVFEGTVPLGRAGSFGYNVRVVPRHPLLASAAELGLIAVAD